MASKGKTTKTTKPAKATKALKTTKSVKTSKPEKKDSKKKVEESKKADEMKPSDRFYNRELSWLEFNDRILHESRDNKNPLLERLNFLAITASNLDEFYTVRVASLRDMASVNFEEKDIAGMTVNEQLSAIDSRARQLMSMMYSTYSRSLVPSLKQEKVFIVDYDELSDSNMDRCDEYFNTVLYPIVTPMAIDSSRPLPLIQNKHLNLCVKLEGKGLATTNDDDTVYATLQVPNVVPRLFKLTGSDGEVILVPIESIIKANLDVLFINQTVISSGCYRVMRNADLDIDEDDAEDLLKEIEEQVRKRRYGEILKLEVEDDINPEMLDYLVRELNISKGDIFEVDGPIDLTFLSKVNGLLGKENYNDLRYKSHKAAYPAMFDETLDNIFDQIRKKDRIVHHPYESFEPVLEFIKQAATDPNVLAIKQTLYRVSSNSPIIASLLEAARNGKQVMVLVELKARFDEENNINWAKMLEKAGCHVIYGLVGLKTHSKITLVVRKEEDGIRRYLHLATGNYNDVTANIYTDMGLFTASESFGEDASEFFNMLSGYSIPSTWRKLVPAPLWMKDHFVKNIRREADNALAGKPARIVAKINSLVDGNIIKELYKASNAGVKIDLIVRGICCLRAGVPGLSENITVRSITGRFLEHSRIFLFYNEGQQDLYLASADWMPRNLNRRVELMFPIEDIDCRNRVLEVLDVQLNDTIRAHFMNADGSYHKLDLRGKVKLDSQQKLIDLAEEAVKARNSEIEKLSFEPATAPEDK
ncbi:MAG: RNA degradosome polyphosphate kinase [Saccharofermentans sp.]|nr:RNA degradosome polyphosphate kinase [Saccharofermentans sp.]